MLSAKAFSAIKAACKHVDKIDPWREAKKLLENAFGLAQGEGGQGEGEGAPLGIKEVVCVHAIEGVPFNVGEVCRWQCIIRKGGCA